MKTLEIPVVKLPKETEELRREIRQFLKEEIENGLIETKCDCWLSGFSEDFSRKMGARGWIGMTWPKKYGGGERSSVERYVVTEEMLAAGAPVSGHWIADRQTGPLLLKYGTEEQKQFFLPRIAKGECYFAIGLSEPNAGSDLAALQARAVKVDKGWILNGSKIWTSGAHHAHYSIVLCRTTPMDPNNRHAGMSQLIVDLNAPGVTIRPIHLMTGEHHFNEVFFEDVFVPDGMVVGTLGNGWAQGMAELAYERSGPERILSTFPLLNELTNVLIEKCDAKGLNEVSRLISRLWTLRNMSLGIARLLEEGVPSNIIASLVKDMGTQFEQEIPEITRLLVSVIPLTDSENRLERFLAQSILQSPGFTLRGGTTEILRGIVAKGVINQ
ncbi:MULTISPECIES: acyl-CoA dehydrogenase family protein [Neobacillus]|uniref:Acyl-CoA dehydrogenase family protein n=1 Tax=Neobacillus rhizophilus TaxID=2833579 RepID=A0A942U170_9BACI|nr:MULTISPECIES: acyl-CoA dehydrogenase family protein [Neobacillus]MBS4211370.1 acyl-CoA dehydrogenase family protein [Neobacillus rhizophilus]MBU8916788.1 acyl-CoA dehydrogenase family protein [Bacillus sp. FJAT-29953]